MTLGSHQQTLGKSQVHITPKWIIDALGPFDLDPCAAFPRPWNCATENLSEADDGLGAEWLPHEFLWCNPPFDRRVVGKWVAQVADHNNGILLVHARIETRWFLPVWQKSKAVLFLNKRLNFCREDGTPNSKDNGMPGNSGAPIAIAAFGVLALTRLVDSKIPGTLVTSWSSQ